MNKLLLDPVIICLILVLSILLCVSLIYVIEKKKVSNTIEKLFIAIFLIVISGATPVPFNYLNPSSLAIADIQLTSVTVISQCLFYSLILFLIRSKVIYFYLGILYLVRNPFLSGLLLLTVLSVFWSETPSVTFRASSIFLIYSVFASYVASRYSFQEIGKILRGTGTFIAVFGGLTAILVPSIGRMQDPDPELFGRWKGILNHKNSFAFWMALTATLWLLHAINHPKSRLTSIGLALLSLSAMLPAGSGSSKLVFFLMIGVVLLSQLISQLRRLDFRKTAVITICLIVVTGLFAAILSLNTAIVLSLLGKEATLTGRTEFWPQVIQAIGRKPLLGYGYGGFWQSWRSYENPARSIITPVEFVPPNAHNGYLEILLSTGLIGASLFCLSLMTIFTMLAMFAVKSKNGEAEIATIVLIFSLITSFSESNIWGMNHYSFLFFLTSTRLSIDVARKFSKSENFAYLSPTNSKSKSY